MELAHSYKATLERIRNACEHSSRSPQSIRLLVASKAQTVERIAQTHALGQKYFGENYAQELCTKAPQLPSSIEWSFIGHIQSNKIKKIVQYANEIQTLASLKHAELIARSAEELSKTPYKVFIEVQIPGDESKSGLPWNEVSSFAKDIEAKFPSLQVEGLMAIPPQRFAKEWNKEGEELYRKIRTLASTVGKGKLSLGMSQDLEHAIACGTDIVRIGTAIMGTRHPGGI